MNRFEKTFTFFFSPYGRLTRLDYAMAMAAFWVILYIGGRAGGLALIQPLALFLTFPTVCLAARRWHDFNFRGYWWLLRFTPLPLFVLMPSALTYLIVQVAPLVVLLVECVIPGNVTANRFGPVPTGIAFGYLSRRRATPVPVAARKSSRPAAKSAKPKPASRKKKK